MNTQPRKFYDGLANEAGSEPPSIEQVNEVSVEDWYNKWMGGEIKRNNGDDYLGMLKDFSALSPVAGESDAVELVDCIHNLMAVVDSPVGRLQIKSTYADEARQIGREILKRNNRSLIG